MECGASWTKALPTWNATLPGMRLYLIYFILASPEDFIQLQGVQGCRTWNVGYGMIGMLPFLDCGPTSNVGL